ATRLQLRTAVAQKAVTVDIIDVTISWRIECAFHFAPLKGKARHLRSTCKKRRRDSDIDDVHRQLPCLRHCAIPEVANRPKIGTRRMRMSPHDPGKEGYRKGRCSKQENLEPTPWSRHDQTALCRLDVIASAI